MHIRIKLRTVLGTVLFDLEKHRHVYGVEFGHLFAVHLSISFYLIYIHIH